MASCQEKVLECIKMKVRTKEYGKSRMRLKLFGNFKGEWKPIIPQ